MNVARREVLAMATTAAAGLLLRPAPAVAAEDNLSFVHPDLRAAAQAILARTGQDKPFSRDNLAARRAAQGASPFAPLPTPPSVRRRVRGKGNLPEVDVYVVNARPGAARPAIVEMHGGGFIMGNAARTLAITQRLAASLDCVIVSVDYRLAPETTYAGSMSDTYSALKWLFDEAESLGVDRARIAVMGGSAGGGHAALLAQQAHDRGEVPVCFQCLTYPMLDDRTGSVRTPPYPAGALFYTAPSNRFAWESFLGQTPGTAKVPSAAVPARRADLKGLPPAYVGVGSIDLFVDEDIDYARRLIAAGVATELDVVPGAFHGFELIAPDTKVGRAFADRRLEALRRALQPD
jgi:acetyl esterase/lipase